MNPHPDPSSTFQQLVALADRQYTLYNQNQNPDDAALDLVIRQYCAAFDADPAPDTPAVYILSYLQFHQAALLQKLRRGDSTVNTISNRYVDKVLGFTPPTHPLRPILLIDQATSYKQRYQHTGEIADLQSAVGILQSVMDTIDTSHPQRVHFQTEYGSILYARYTALQDEDDLNLAIEQFEKVLENCPATDLVMPVRQLLAVALDARYKLRNDITDIDRSIDAYAAIVDLLQQQPIEYLTVCMGYAIVLRVRFYRKGDPDDLDVAIRYFEVVITRCPPGHMHYAAAVIFYATLLMDRSRQRISGQDIDKAIGYLDQGIDAGRVDDPSRPELISILGSYLVARFMRYGNATDLESAVDKCYIAISSHASLDAATRAGNMDRLAFALFTRYQLQGDQMDASHAKAYLKEALELCPLSHHARLSILNNYARILGNLARDDANYTRVSGNGASVDETLDDLNLSIRYFREALETCHPPSRPTLLSNLAVVLLYRYSQLGDMSDVDDAFALTEAALKLQTEDHPNRGITLLFQAKAVIARFSQTHSIVDTKVALDILYAARDAFISGYPLLIETYRELSRVYSHRHTITNDNSDLENAFKYRIEATKYANGGSQFQFQTAMQWVESAEKVGHPSMLDAYRSAIDILHLHLVLKPTLNLRHHIIKSQALSICADATSCALRCNDVVGAVEMFERSRGLFWTFMARLRTPLDELQDVPGGQDLAKEFENLSRQLETPMTLGDDGEEHGQRFRRIQRDWNAVVDKIRAVDGFARFLLPPSYEELRAAASGGPVVILNASRHSCDAVVVLAQTDPIHIAFQDVTYSEIDKLSTDFQLAIRNLRRCPIDPNDKGRKREVNNLRILLRRLWDPIVCKVVQALEPHVEKDARIWWCPTGVFTSLPIHAAHPYRKGVRGLWDTFISSYTPTLSALIRSRKQKQDMLQAPSFVSIGQPDSPGLDVLASVGQELKLVRRLVPESVPFTELIDETATREAALKALRTHTFAHLACHGHQVPDRPYESYFAMRDGRVTLLDIVHSQVDVTEFAFLSACKTAKGDADVPDEVVHLAAALQFAGVRNVVGTMWSVDDEVVGYIVEAFYLAMVCDGVFDPRRAAMALRGATKGTKDLPLEQRIVFIHIGA